MSSHEYEHNSFLLYKDSRIFVSKLDKGQRGDLLMTIFDYACDGAIPDFHNDGMLQMCFEIIKSYLDRDEKKYKEKCKKRAEAGRKGGLAKASNTKQSKANLADNDTDNDTDSVSVIDTDTDTVSDTDAKKSDFALVACRSATAAAGAEPPVSDLFSVKQIQAIVKKNKVMLTAEGVHVFREEMQDSGWVLFEKPIEKKGITRALRAWAKYHPEYHPDVEDYEDDLDEQENKEKHKNEAPRRKLTQRELDAIYIEMYGSEEEKEAFRLGKI